MTESGNKAEQNRAVFDEKLRQAGRVEVERAEPKVVFWSDGMDAPHSEQEREEARKFIQTELKRRGWTVAMAARKFKIAKADIQAALSHRSKVNPDPALRRLVQALRLDPAPREAVSELQRFVDIALVEDIHATVAEGIDLCRAGTPFMSLVTGPAGCGKTLALE